jgi:hypothetical protein
MLWLCLLELVCLRLFGGGLAQDIIVWFQIYYLTIDIGPRANTETIVGEEYAEIQDVLEHSHQK